MTYRTLNGVEAGTALLVLMAGIKLLETRSVRDLTVLVFLSYFALFAAFLYDQSLLRLPYMLLTAWVLTITLLRTHQRPSSMSVREAIELTGRIFLQALPLAVLLFLLFPRLPGQFWPIPARSSSGTGIDGEMTPGDISELSLSGAIAFRVKFIGDMPPPGERCWRGPVLHDFDGPHLAHGQHATAGAAGAGARPDLSISADTRAAPAALDLCAGRRDELAGAARPAHGRPAAALTRPGMGRQLRSFCARAGESPPTCPPPRPSQTPA